MSLTLHGLAIAYTICQSVKRVYRMGALPASLPTPASHCTTHRHLLDALFFHRPTSSMLL
jgi:hypothetical protein